MRVGKNAKAGAGQKQGHGVFKLFFSRMRPSFLPSPAPPLARVATPFPRPDARVLKHAQLSPRTMSFSAAVSLSPVPVPLAALFVHRTSPQ